MKRCFWPIVATLAFAAACLNARSLDAAESGAPEAALWDMALPNNVPPTGFIALFNGKDLANWKGLVSPAGGPPARAKMTPEQLATAQEKADKQMRDHWTVVDGILNYDGKGQSLCTAKDYDDIEMWVDWKITRNGDSGIYLRGSPQVQIWDPFNTPIAAAGSGGLYNNQKYPHDPLVKVDRPIGEWNRFFIRMVGDKVTVYFNEALVVDNVVLENYWERDKPIYPTGQIELQHHNSTLFFKNIYLRELKKD
jgi:hypothetical protein